MKLKTIYLLLPLLISCASNKLPAPEVSSSYRGQQFGVDKNINEETLDKYLFRNDVVYRDMRMLVDPADYGEIDGDSYLSGFVQGFEVVPFPYIAPLGELPVSGAYDGPTLFKLENEHYVPIYEESLDIVNALFPNNKAIFLMCGGGGYAGMMKSFLLDIGYNSKYLYNVGGYWFYEGDYNVQVKRVENDETYYDFYKVAYHDIDFTELHEII